MGLFGRKKKIKNDSNREWTSFEFVQFLIKYPDTSDEDFDMMYENLLGEDTLEKDMEDYWKMLLAEDKITQEGFKKIKISFLANFTIELIEPFIKVELVKRNFNPEIYFAPYDQIEHEVYNVNSKIYREKNDIIVIAIRLENLLPNLFTDLIYSDKKFKNKINEIKKRIFNLIKQIRNKNTLSKIIFFDTRLLSVSCG